MKRQRENKQQDVLNKSQVNKHDENHYKVIKMKGKIMQKIVHESKFKQINTVIFPPLCLDKELTAALIQLERIEDIDELNSLITPHIVVYKHLLSNGYKTRPIREGYIGIIDIKNHESCIRVTTANDNLLNVLNHIDHSLPVEHLAVVQEKNVVFISLTSFSSSLLQNVN